MIQYPLTRTRPLASKPEDELDQTDVIANRDRVVRFPSGLKAGRTIALVSNGAWNTPMTSAVFFKTREKLKRIPKELIIETPASKRRDKKKNQAKLKKQKEKETRRKKKEKKRKKKKEKREQEEKDKEENKETDVALNTSSKDEVGLAEELLPSTEGLSVPQEEEKEKETEVPPPSEDHPPSEHEAEEEKEEEEEKEGEDQPIEFEDEEDEKEEEEEKEKSRKRKKDKKKKKRKRHEMEDEEEQDGEESERKKKKSKKKKRRKTNTEEESLQNETKLEVVESLPDSQTKETKQEEEEQEVEINWDWEDNNDENKSSLKEDDKTSKKKKLTFFEKEREDEKHRKEVEKKRKEQEDHLQNLIYETRRTEESLSIEFSSAGTYNDNQALLIHLFQSCTTIAQVEQVATQYLSISSPWTWIIVSPNMVRKKMISNDDYTVSNCDEIICYVRNEERNLRETHLISPAKSQKLSSGILRLDNDDAAPIIQFNSHHICFSSNKIKPFILVWTNEDKEKEEEEQRRKDKEDKQETEAGDSLSKKDKSKKKKKRSKKGKKKANDEEEEPKQLEEEEQVPIVPSILEEEQPPKEDQPAVEQEEEKREENEPIAPLPMIHSDNEENEEEKDAATEEEKIPIPWMKYGLYLKNYIMEGKEEKALSLLVKFFEGDTTRYVKVLGEKCRILSELCYLTEILLDICVTSYILHKLLGTLLYYYLFCCLISDKDVPAKKKRQLGMNIRTDMEEMVRQLCRLFEMGPYVNYELKKRDAQLLTAEEMNVITAWKARDIVLKQSLQSYETVIEVHRNNSTELLDESRTEEASILSMMSKIQALTPLHLDWDSFSRYCCFCFLCEQKETSEIVLMDEQDEEDQDYINHRELDLDVVIKVGPIYEVSANGKRTKEEDYDVMEDEDHESSNKKRKRREQKKEKKTVKKDSEHKAINSSTEDSTKDSTVINLAGHMKNLLNVKDWHKWWETVLSIPCSLSNSDTKPAVASSESSVMEKPNDNDDDDDDSWMKPFSFVDDEKVVEEKTDDLQQQEEEEEEEDEEDEFLSLINKSLSDRDLHPPRWYQRRIKWKSREDYLALLLIPQISNLLCMSYDYNCSVNSWNSRLCSSDGNRHEACGCLGRQSKIDPSTKKDAQGDPLQDPRIQIMETKTRGYRLWNSFVWCHLFDCNLLYGGDTFLRSAITQKQREYLFRTWQWTRMTAEQKKLIGQTIDMNPPSKWHSLFSMNSTKETKTVKQVKKKPVTLGEKKTQIMAMNRKLIIVPRGVLLAPNFSKYLETHHNKAVFQLPKYVNEIAKWKENTAYIPPSDSLDVLLGWVEYYNTVVQPSIRTDISSFQYTTNHRLTIEEITHLWDVDPENIKMIIDVQYESILRNMASLSIKKHSSKQDYATFVLRHMIRAFRCYNSLADPASQLATSKEEEKKRLSQPPPSLLFSLPPMSTSSSLRAIKMDVDEKGEEEQNEEEKKGLHLETCEWALEDELAICYHVIQQMEEEKDVDEKPIVLCVDTYFYEEWNLLCQFAKETTTCSLLNMACYQLRIRLEMILQLLSSEKEEAALPLLDLSLDPFYYKNQVDVVTDHQGALGPILLPMWSRLLTILLFAPCDVFRLNNSNGTLWKAVINKKLLLKLLPIYIKRIFDCECQTLHYKWKLGSFPDQIVNNEISQLMIKKEFESRALVHTQDPIVCCGIFQESFDTREQVQILMNRLIGYSKRTLFIFEEENSELFGLLMRDTIDKKMCILFSDGACLSSHSFLSKRQLISSKLDRLKYAALHKTILSDIDNARVVVCSRNVLMPTQSFKIKNNHLWCGLNLVTQSFFYNRVFYVPSKLKQLTVKKSTWLTNLIPLIPCHPTSVWYIQTNYIRLNSNLENADAKKNPLSTGEKRLKEIMAIDKEQDEFEMKIQTSEFQRVNIPFSLVSTRSQYCLTGPISTKLFSLVTIIRPSQVWKDKVVSLVSNVLNQVIRTDWDTFNWFWNIISDSMIMPWANPLPPLIPLVTSNGPNITSNIGQVHPEDEKLIRSALQSNGSSSVVDPLPPVKKEKKEKKSKKKQEKMGEESDYDIDMDDFEPDSDPEPPAQPQPQPTEPESEVKKLEEVEKKPLESDPQFLIRYPSEIKKVDTYMIKNGCIEIDPDCIGKWRAKWTEEDHEFWWNFYEQCKRKVPNIGFGIKLKSSDSSSLAEDRDDLWINALQSFLCPTLGGTESTENQKWWAVAVLDYKIKKRMSKLLTVTIVSENDDNKKPRRRRSKKKQLEVDNQEENGSLTFEDKEEQKKISRQERKDSKLLEDLYSRMDDFMSLLRWRYTKKWISMCMNLLCPSMEYNGQLFPVLVKNSRENSREAKEAKEPQIIFLYNQEVIANEVKKSLLEIQKDKNLSPSGSEKIYPCPIETSTKTLREQIEHHSHRMTRKCFFFMCVNQCKVVEVNELWKHYRYFVFAKASVKTEVFPAEWQEFLSHRLYFLL